MPIAVDFFIRHGYLLVFAWVLAEQLGIPAPSTPLLIMAGTLTATHRIAMAPVVLAALAGSLIADSIWYVFDEILPGLFLQEPAYKIFHCFLLA